MAILPILKIGHPILGRPDEDRMADLEDGEYRHCPDPIL